MTTQSPLTDPSPASAPEGRFRIRKDNVPPNLAFAVEQYDDGKWCPLFYVSDRATAEREIERLTAPEVDGWQRIVKELVRIQRDVPGLTPAERGAIFCAATALRTPSPSVQGTEWPSEELTAAADWCDDRARDERLHNEDRKEAKVNAGAFDRAANIIRRVASPSGPEPGGVRPKVVTLCGSSRFVDVMAVCAWLIERDEKAIAMSLHLLPGWYPNCPTDHLAEHEGVAGEMDALHLRKIDRSDEIFVVNVNDYIGSSTTKEIEHAKATGKPIRWFTHDPIGSRVIEMLAALASPAPGSERELREGAKEAERALSGIEAWCGKGMLTGNRAKVWNYVGDRLDKLRAALDRKGEE